MLLGQMSRDVLGVIIETDFLEMVDIVEDAAVVRAIRVERRRLGGLGGSHGGW